MITRRSKWRRLNRWSANVMPTIVAHREFLHQNHLNNIVEQDHRGIKSRTGPMLGFKRFDHATIVIAGIKLARKIKKGQFNVHRLGIFAHTAESVYSRGHVLTVELRYRYTLAFERPYFFMSA